ncbi:MAG TPA: SRPBCC family protein [Candidatus Dormibacteraeota bacterium]|nr:SRPBCC family protein [Candidatus Dormibacteraeota bacterium]HVC22650.1 SRPBCC family protein [Candidatus Dormibacteraeota bacterium]
MSDKNTVLQVEPAAQEVVLTRTFDAPRELVFRVYTDPHLLPRWWGPSSLSTIVESMDVRPGGVWRFVQRDKDGAEFAFPGVYHEVSPPARLVTTFEFEGASGHVVLETTTFDEVAGKTQLTTRSVFQSVEDRDQMVASGMERGARESMERLAALVAAG